MNFIWSWRPAGSLRFFSEREAWNLFRLAAFGEAFGWTLLISGIAVSRYLMHGNRDAITVAGQLHGTIFLVYLAAAVVLSASLGWSRRKTVIAVAASVPPYGTLVFEQWAARRRKLELARDYRQIVVRGIILKGSSVLAAQPRETLDWYLPGGSVKASETAETALIRQIRAQTGQSPKIGALIYMYQARAGGVEILELYFHIINAAAFRAVSVDSQALDGDVDEQAFVNPRTTTELRPRFLQTVALGRDVKAGVTRSINQP